MKKIFVVYGHYSDESFNASIKTTFIETAKEKGHEIDCVDLYKEKFEPVFSGEKPDDVVLDHQRRIKNSLFCVGQETMEAMAWLSPKF